MIRNSLWLALGSLILFTGCNTHTPLPSGVKLQIETLTRTGSHGDNWCITWAPDDSQLTSMDDGNWLKGPHEYHNHLYRIRGDADNFTREDLPGYPQITRSMGGWFGYGILSVDNKLYSMVSRTPHVDWDGPFRGMKMLKSTDNGQSWSRVNSLGEERLLDPLDTAAMEDLSKEEMFFMEESGQFNHGEKAYPFSFCSFVQNGQANAAAKDDYIYIYSPEGSKAHLLLLARVKTDEIEFRDRWEYFSSWEDDQPVWTSDLDNRGVVHEFPAKNDAGEYFGWYSWLPSVVWNEGLGLYIMVNGGTYGGFGMSDSPEDYYNMWMHTKTGSLGFWYAENPYGPWTRFHYEETWIVDNEKNRTYQPKLSPKWISKDGTRMMLIWSDAMKNDEGYSHTVNYLWNQMEIEIVLE